METTSATVQVTVELPRSVLAALRRDPEEFTESPRQVFRPVEGHPPLPPTSAPRASGLAASPNPG